MCTSCTWATTLTMIRYSLRVTSIIVMMYRGCTSVNQSSAARRGLPKWALQLGLAA